MKRLWVFVALLGLLVTACNTNLGRAIPSCADTVSNSMVVQVQSVPDAAYVSCINGLFTGWDYEHLQAKSGSSVYWLDSDRMGDEFVTIETVGSCDPGGAGPGNAAYV